MPHLLRLIVFALGFSFPASVLAHEPDDAEHRVVEETVEEVEVEMPGRSTWMGLRVGSVLTPYRHTGPITPGKRVTSNQARACLDPVDLRYCGSVRGLDLRVEMFEARGRTSYPRWTVFFRTGYTAGRFAFDAFDHETGFDPGEARALSYHTVPLFFGTNLYLFEKFPIRPYGGLGFGFDVLRLQYHRHQTNDRIDASGRIGFELHGGLEARITNYVSLNVEVMQLWSARRKIAGLPDYSNEGLTFIGGIAFAIPTEHSRRRKEIRKVRRVERVEEPAKARAEPRAPAPMPPWHVEIVQKQEVQAGTVPPQTPMAGAEESSSPDAARGPTPEGPTPEGPAPEAPSPEGPAPEGPPATPAPAP